MNPLQIAGASWAPIWSTALAVGQTLGNLYEQRRNEAFQREMAQNGIRWRVADAEAAGLSPLSAIGSTGASGSSPSFLGNTLGDMGQDVTRAMLASSTDAEKADAAGRAKLVESQLAETDARTEGIRLQNSKLMQELYGQPGLPSLFPSGGLPSHGKGLVVPEDMQFYSGLRGAVSPESVKIPSASVASRAVQAGARPAWQAVRLSDGTTVYLPDAGEGQTFLGNNPVTGGLLAGGQWMWQRSGDPLNYLDRKATEFAGSLRRGYDAVQRWGHSPYGGK